MPTTPYATLLASIAAGAATAGGATATPGQTCQLSGESTIGWTAQLFEIYSYPAGFAAPAGWSTDAAGVYFYSTTSTPPLITLSAATTPAKYLFRLTVNGGLSGAGVADATLVDEATAVRVAGIGGLHAFAHGETSQWNTQAKWAGDLRDDIVILDTSLAALPVPAAPTVTVKSEATAAAAGAAATILRTDAQLQAATAVPSVAVLSDASTFSQGAASTLLRSDARLLATTAAASSIGTANTQGASTSLARADHGHNHGAQTEPTHHAAATAVAAGFVTLAGDLAGTGSTGAAPRTSGINSATVPAAGALTTGNVLQVTGASALGYAAVNLAGGAAYVTGVLPVANVDAATTPAVSKLAKWGASLELGELYFHADGLSIGMAPSFGGGVKVLGLANRTTAPTTAPKDGIVAYAEAGAAKVWSPKKLRTALAPETNNAATDQRLDGIHQSVTTADATPTVIATYALPTACCFVARIFVTGQQTGTDTTAVYAFDVTAKRAAGACAVTAPTVTTLIDSIGVAAVPSVTNATNDVQFSVTGKAATSIDWAISSVHVHLFSV